MFFPFERQMERTEWLERGPLGCYSKKWGLLQLWYFFQSSSKQHQYNINTTCYRILQEGNAGPNGTFTRSGEIQRRCFGAPDGHQSQWGQGRRPGKEPKSALVVVLTLSVFFALSVFLVPSCLSFLYLLPLLWSFSSEVFWGMSIGQTGCVSDSEIH